MSKTRSLWAWALIPIVVVADQWSKWLILNDARFRSLECLDGQAICGHVPLPGPIDLTMVWNRGMSYGLMQSEGLMRWTVSLGRLENSRKFLNTLSICLISSPMTLKSSFWLSFKPRLLSRENRRILTDVRGLRME